MRAVEGTQEKTAPPNTRLLKFTHTNCFVSLPPVSSNSFQLLTACTYPKMIFAARNSLV